MKTIGRWPWKSASGKKRVITYLWNLAATKIDGAYAYTDAFGKGACFYCRRYIVKYSGDLNSADLGGSSENSRK